MLSFIVRLTALFLGLGSLLVIVGIFDNYLGWDIFGPQLESLLYGVFFACLVLAGSGIALSFVLGVKEIAELLRASLSGQSLPPPRPMRRYVGFTALGVLAISLLILALEIGDRRIQAERNRVFQRVASDTIEPFSERLVAQLPVGIPRPKPGAEVDQVMDAINGHDWVARATIYLPDVNDEERLWEYEAHRGGSSESRFDRMFPASRHERAIQRAFAGGPRVLREFNESSSFSFLHPLRVDQSLIGVVWVKANKETSFRE